MRLRCLPAQKVVLLLFVVQHNVLAMLEQHGETIGVRIFQIRPLPGGHRLVRNTNVARRPATGQTHQIVHLAGDRFGLLDGTLRGAAGRRRTAGRGGGGVIRLGGHHLHGIRPGR